MNNKQAVNNFEKKVCKYCGGKASDGVCYHCKEKMAIISRIKAMLGGAKDEQ